MNHVVRRLMEAGDIPITRLRRERVGPLSIAGIPRGASRDLTAGELVSLRQALKLDRDPGADAIASGQKPPARSRPQRTRGTHHA
jgi:hypothetical protein